MDIKVLGLGCGKCIKTFNLIEKIIKDNKLDINLSKVDDIEQMTKYDCCFTPAVVIDEKVVLKGYVPSEKEIKSLIL